MLPRPSPIPELSVSECEDEEKEMIEMTEMESRFSVNGARNSFEWNKLLSKVRNSIWRRDEETGEDEENGVGIKKQVSCVSLDQRMIANGYYDEVNEVDEAKKNSGKSKYRRHNYKFKS